MRSESSCPRRHTVPWLTLALALALPDCGGGSSSTTPATIPTTTQPPVTAPPVPTRLGDLSASVTSPQSEADINCNGNVTVRVTLVNNGQTDVAVRGLLTRLGVVTGDCGGQFEGTLRTRTSVAPGRSSTVVYDQPLFTNGPGCCRGRGCAGACRFQLGFEVLTDLGHVPAGVVNYRVFFQNCQPCGSARAAAIEGQGCAPAFLPGAP